MMETLKRLLVVLFSPLLMMFFAAMVVYEDVRYGDVR